MVNKYPHSNFHELDLDWLLRKVKALETWREKVVDPFIKAFTTWKTTIVDPFIADIAERMLNVEIALDSKQDKLTAGTNIEITAQNVINNTYTLPNASTSTAGGIRTYWDSVNSTLYITDNGTDPTPTP